jgi:hypothetical protein
VKRLLAAAALGLLVSACGGSGSPPSSPPPPPTSEDPCATAAIEEDLEAPPATGAAARARKTNVLDGNPRWRVLDALWTHREAEGRERPSTALGTGPSTALGTGPSTALGAGRLTRSRNTADVGEIAVVQDEGDLILPPNTYDLRSLGLRFTRNSAGGYDVVRIDGAFRSALGARLILTDDDSVNRAVPFTFSFYGTGETAAFVNSDGNITFGEADKASTDRNVARVLTGPPRVSPFFSDLDPTTGSGRIFLNAAADQYTVTWCNVRGFDSTLTTTVQATLLPSGVIEMKFGATPTVTDAVVALSPGRTGIFTPVNLSEPGPTAGGSAAVGERFARQPQIDLVEVSRKFYRTHADLYDQLVLWSDAPVITDAFAYETTIANEVRGIGLDIFDLASDFGSGGRLRSLVVMDWLGKYPPTPTQKFLGENNTLSLLGQESGHRWLAFMEMLDHNRQRSDALLGRDLAHWSFFLDSDGSVMEGNDIEDLGGGSFRTAGAVQRYSLLDQYAMGLVPETAVPEFFYVESPMLTTRTREAAPQIGVTFTGTRRPVLIQDVVAVHGRREPTPDQTSKVHRQAFIYLVSAGRTANSEQIAKLDEIRRAWEGFFAQATDGRMQAVTGLR